MLKWLLLSLVAFSLHAEEELELDLPVLEPTPQYKNPWLAAGFSAVLPGLGHAYLGDNTQAMTLSASWGANWGMKKFDKKANFWKETSLSSNFLMGYSVYAAYRDARNFNGQENYSYKMPEESFKDLVYAPFQFSVWKKPEVWGGVLGCLFVSAVVSNLVFSEVSKMHIAMSDATHHPALAFPVGIWEESLFRGFLQPALIEATNPWVGIALSSIGFGAAHLSNVDGMETRFERHRYKLFILPYISLMGGYMGWLSYKNQSLKESVAVHAWYDFVLFLGSAVARSASIGKPSFSLSFAF